MYVILESGFPYPLYFGSDPDPLIIPLTDPVPDPNLFLSSLQDAKENIKKILHVF
jgi:hypothetical protein